MTPDQIHDSAQFLASHLFTQRNAEKQIDADRLQEPVNLIALTLRRAVGYPWYSIISVVAEDIVRRRMEENA